MNELIEEKNGLKIKGSEIWSDTSGAKWNLGGTFEARLAEQRQNKRGE